MANKKRPLIIWIVAILLIIIGVCIAFIHNPLRGSGLGTLCMASGVILIVVALVRQNKK